MEDIRDALREPLPGLAAQALGGAASWGGGGIAFIKMGIYDIVIAENARDLPGALSQIDVAKRPTVNDAVFEALAKWYQCPFAFCCFNSEQKGESTPLAFAFEPRYPDQLHVYTLDGHDGNPPDLRKPAQLDHTIFVGSYLADKRKCAIRRWLHAEHGQR